MDGVSIVTNPGLEMSGLGGRCLGGQTDSDHDSVVSDYSEMADPVKEHLASIHLLQEAELQFSNVLGLPAQQLHLIRPWLAVQRRPDEDEVEFLKRQRKINFLSLAQEFAAVKMVNPNALPFCHKPRNDGDGKDEENESLADRSLAEEFAAVSCAEKTEDELSQFGPSDVHSTAADDTHIIQSSSDTAEEECSSESAVTVCSVPDVVHDSAHCDVSQPSDTNCVRVDLVHECHSSDAWSGTDAGVNISDALLANSVMSHSKNMDLLRQQQRENIRLKLVVSDDGDNDDTILPGEVISCPSSYASLRMCYVNEAAFDDDDDDVDCYREELITGPMASPDLIAGMRRPAEQGDLPETRVMEWKLDSYDRLTLQQLNTAQLQVIVNDQLNQIEALNNDLVECLVERDDLLRRQDSLLVDVEDLSRFLTKVTSPMHSEAS